MGLSCPYCGRKIADPGECYDEDEAYEHECPQCGQNFVFRAEYSREYFAQKAPCLNGGEHKWVGIFGIPKELFVNKRRCSVCEELKTLTPHDAGYVEVNPKEALC